jgi:hypothetical protein
VNTDRVIDLLSANLEPARHVHFGKTLLLAMIMGGAAAVALMLATVGPRADPDSNNSSRMDGVEACPSSECDCLGSSISRPLDASWTGEQNELAAGVLFFRRGHRRGPCDASHCSATNLDRDAAWGQPDFVSAVFPLHIGLCCDAIGSPDVGASRRHTNSIGSVWGARGNRR